MNFNTETKLDCSKISKSDLDLLANIEQAAVSAAKLILKKLEQGANLNSWRKGDDTVVTEADIESQAFLIESLKGTLPLVGEEDPSSYRFVESEKNYILIDPLDGTTSARRFGTASGGQVGYGPIVGLVRDSRLLAAVYVNIPLRRVFTAVIGGGCESYSLLDTQSVRTLLPKIEERPMDKAALLFYAGKQGELEALTKLRKASSIENYYRFGGFANDAIRVALDHEQLQLQFSVKAWDLPAVLIPHEVGCRVIFSPLTNPCELMDYNPQLENPLLLGQSALVEQVLNIIRVQ